MRFCLPIYLFCVVFIVSCQNQKKEEETSKDVSLSTIYQKFYENRYDFGFKEGDGKDSILNRFENTLINMLRNKKFSKDEFKILSQKINLVSSDDSKLRIFSWDEYGGGSRHIYNSVYQFNTSDKSFSGYLPIINKEATYYQISKNKYLVVGYGTHGRGKEFYIYRLLSFKGGKITDCLKCFNGENSFFYEVSRGEESIPVYNALTKEIIYQEQNEHYIDGNKNSPSGFKFPTAKVLKLKYKEGYFLQETE